MSKFKVKVNKQKGNNDNKIRFGNYLILLKNSTDIVSAIEAQDVGCPDLALEVDSTECILNLVAMSFSIS